jgi:RimJ/RimL family protein N-acetyltransferase
VKIRALTPADASEFHAIRLRAFSEHPAAFGTSYETQVNTSIDDVTERLRTDLTFGDNFVLGCFVECKLTGVVGFARSDGLKERHKGWLWGMYVASEFQGKGYGRALLHEAVNRARKVLGLRQLHLSVVTPNPSAQALYSQAGFESYGIEPDALYVNGIYYSEDYLVLCLDSEI